MTKQQILNVLQETGKADLSVPEGKGNPKRGGQSPVSFSRRFGGFFI